MTVGQLYDQLAKDTGGVVLTIATGDDLGSSFRRVLDDFRASYVLYFSPHGVRGGGLHTLDVRVKRDGVDVRARRAYVWHPDQAKAVPSDCNGIARVANRTLTAINSPSRTRDPPTIGTGRSRNC